MFFDQFGATETLVATGITPEVFERLKDVLRGHGVTVPDGDRGHMTAWGVGGEFRWNRESEKLEIEIKDKPFLIPQHLIVAHYRDAIMEAGGQPA